VAVTFNGTSLPATATESGMDFFLVNRAAHSTQYIGSPRYDEQNIGQYTFAAGTDHFSTLIVSGTYDVLMQRGASTSDNGLTYVYRTDSNDTLPNAATLLQQNVVFSGGTQPLTIDIPTSTVSINVTQDGAAMPATATESGPDFFLVDATTHASQYIGSVRYDEQNIGQYTLAAGTDPFGTLVVAGTYDVVMQRGASTSSTSAKTYVYRTDSADTLPNGDIVLQKNLVIHSGAQSLHIDVPTSHVNVSVTLNGAALPATATESAMDFLLIDRSTGATQYIGSPRYDEQNIGQYTFVAGTDHFSTYVPAGAYDVLMQRGASSDDLGRTYVYRTDANDTLPNGAVLLQQNVVLAPGTHALNIDIPSTALSVNLTMNGAAMPATATESGPDFMLVDRSTGAIQYIGGARYDEQNIGQYTLAAGTDHFSTLVTAGTYDVLMERGSSTSSTARDVYVYQTDANDTLPNGYTLLQSNLVVHPGAQTLDIDIPTTLLTVNITMDATQLPATATESGPDFYLVDRTTGATQYLGSPRYDEQNIGQYNFVTGTDTLTTLVAAGSYDVVMRRGASTNSDGTVYVYQTDHNDTLPNGDAILLQSVTLATGSRTLDVDIPATTLGGFVTLDHAALPATATESAMDFFIVNRTTGAVQYLMSPRYDEQNIGQYTFVAGSDAYTSLVLSGTYDLLMQRGASSTTGHGTYVYQTDQSDTLPNGAVYLGRCLYVP
jgi:hypothetical protein